MSGMIKTVFTITSVFLLMVLSMSCESNFKEVQRLGFSEFTPSFQAEDFDLKYTDSGRITSILKSPQMLDFSSVKYPFIEFPKGVNVTFFDKAGKKTYVKSDYGVQYKGTSIIDLQGNVRIWTDAGQLLETEQLYFDQKNNWFFTEKKFKFTDPKGVSFGEGIDFSRDFKIVNSQRINGEVDKSGEM
ncbi:LPS export ABC transporter periplasmic protein LptC [Flavobacterium silvaticum]|uniref:LPS export ABC transporter periplasmic protein LptC n=1 Tax=Flavobacterium silvaticum TaxID=1852020 RepID=A0A972FPS2_9FLAO|nr:LPS export ABC transporter periplasmic protein LptC [Flavobacterium silvaticum]NMH27169.1 LPS export ABC transporter periplasmic protein LptC [Flavobacterium silvaticum]